MSDTNPNTGPQEPSDGEAVIGGLEETPVEEAKTEETKPDAS